MAKKHFDLMLDEEKMEALDRWLDAAGIKRSAYINTLISKTVDSMELEKVTDYSKLSVVQIFSMVGGIGKMMRAQKK